jgi:hypothetical protein
MGLRIRTIGRTSNETESMAALLVRAATDADEFDYAARYRGASCGTVHVRCTALRASSRGSSRRDAPSFASPLWWACGPTSVKAAAIVAAMRRRGDVFAIDHHSLGPTHVASEMSDVLFEELQLERAAVAR